VTGKDDLSYSLNFFIQGSMVFDGKFNAEMFGILI